MSPGEMIYKLRRSENLSQEQFADLFRVSRQSVQKWETDAAMPKLEKIVEISKHFGIPVDALVLGHDVRMAEKMEETRGVKPMPHYAAMHVWEYYPSELLDEFRQSVDEGLDVGAYEELFRAIAKLPKNESKTKLGDVAFEMILDAGTREDYPYTEPNRLEAIRALRDDPPDVGGFDTGAIEEKILGAWTGRVCGCMLGKTLEGIRTDELTPFLKETGNYPMRRYVCRSDVPEAVCRRYNFPFRQRVYADEIDGMPVDDDTNYTVLAQIIIEKYGRDFTPYDVSREWLQCQNKDAYCTAERVAYRNFVNGYEPPQSAVYKNPYREWIGAQIRGDYFGYINPGDPETAAGMAWRDASVSHVKNGIYGEMFVAAMLAVAATGDDMEKIILGGLSQIPRTSRLYDAVMNILRDFKSGVPQAEVFRDIHRKYDEHTGYGWCHVIPNAMIVAASLLYGGGDFGKSVCMAVETGFDTDCNGATVGSVVGMARGRRGIPPCWINPIGDILHTSIFGTGDVRISELAALTVKHIK